jgi:hypothetical protein
VEEELETPAPVPGAIPGVRVNPDGSISRGLGPAPTAQTTVRHACAASGTCACTVATA